MAGRPIVVSIIGDNKKLAGAVDSSNSKLGSLGRVGKGVGLAVAGGLVVAGAAALKMGGAVVKSASNAQQSIGATETVFGKYADTVIKRSNEAAKSVGLSANEYRELSNVTGASLKGAGIPLEQVSNLTGNLNKRAADLAATFGGPTSEAVSAFGSLLRGEADPIERYGISVKQSDVNARLAAQGQDKLTGSQLKQAEMMARLDLAFMQSKDSAGAFGRESDTLANRQQVLGAMFENVKAKAGAVLLPALTSLASFAIDHIIPAFERMGPPIQAFASQAVAVLGPAIGRVVGFFRADVVPAIQAFVGFVVGSVIPTAVRLAGIIGRNLAPVVDAIASTFRQQLMPAIRDGAARFRDMWPQISRVATVLVTVGSVILGRVLPPVIRFAGFLLSNLIPAFVSVIGFAFDVAETIIKIGGAVVNGVQAVGRFAGGVRDKVGAAIGFVRSIPGRISGVFSSAGTMLLNVGKDIIGGLLSGIRSMAGQIVSTITSYVIDKIPGPVRKALGISSPSKVFAEIGRQIVAGLVVGVKGGSAGIRDAIGGLSDDIRKAWEKAGRDKPLKVSSVLDVLDKQLDKLRDKARAYQQLADKLDKARQLAAGVKAAAIGEAALTTVAAIDVLDASGNVIGQTQTAGNLIAGLQAKLTALRTFAAHVDALRKAGLSKSSVDQIIAEGVEKGSLTAAALVAGGPEALAAVNSLQNQITGAAGALGQVAAVNMFGTGQQAAEGFVKGLEDSLGRLDTAAKRIARQLVKAIKRELGIKSPSTVARQLAKSFTDGIVVQTYADSRRAQLAGQATAAALVEGFGRPQVAADALLAGAQGRAGIMQLVLSAEQLDQLQRGRELQADLDAWRGIGGRVIAT